MYTRYAVLRDKMNISDYEVSRQTEISTSTLTDWKKGRYTPKIDKIKKLADFFGVSVEYFLEEKTD